MGRSLIQMKQKLMELGCEISYEGVRGENGKDNKFILLY